MSMPTEHQDPPSNADKGTMLSGFFIGWGVLIAASMLTGLLMTLFTRLPQFAMSFMGMSWLTTLLPQGALIAAMVWAFSKGKTRTGLGILAAIGSMIALALLLVAACFGLLASNGGWH